MRLHSPTHCIDKRDRAGGTEGEKPTTTTKPQAPEATVRFKANSVPSVFTKRIGSCYTSHNNIGPKGLQNVTNYRKADGKEAVYQLGSLTLAEPAPGHWLS